MISPAMFIAALQKGNPAINNQQAMRIWQETSSKADLSALSPQQLAQMAFKISQSTISKPQGYADGGEVTDNAGEAEAAANMPVAQAQPAPSAVQQGAIQLPAVNVPQNYMTPEQEAAQSALLSQNQKNVSEGAALQSPAVLNQHLRDAYAEYQKLQLAQAPARAVSGIISGSAAGSTGGESVRDNALAWKNIQDQNAAQTVGKETEIQKQLLDQYKEGMTANKDLLVDLKDNAKFKIDASSSRLSQTKTQAELLPILQDANQRTEWSDPASATSRAAQDLVSAEMRKLGVSDDTIKSTIAGKSAVQIAATSSFIPGIVKNISDAATAASTQATAAKTSAEQAGLVQTQNLKSRAGVPSVVTPPTTLLGGPATTQPGSATGADTSSKGGQVDAATGLPVGTNNVGNLKDTKTGQFRTFASKQEGMDAVARDLKAKGQQGLDTITKIISKYAPASDNNPTPQYIANVAKWMGVGPDDKLDMNDVGTIVKLRAAIVRQENNTKVTGATSGQASGGPLDYTAQDTKDFGPPKSATQKYPVNLEGGEASYTGESQAQSKAKVIGTDNFIQGYNSTGKASATNVLRNAGNAGYGHIQNIVNIGNNPDVAQLKANIDQLNAGLVKAGLQPGKEESTGAGAVLGTAGAGLARSGGSLPGPVGALATGAGAIMAGAAGMVNGGQPLTITSPPDRLRDASIKLQTFAEQQRLLLPKLRTFAEKNNYNIDGWSETPIYKEVMAMIPVVNKNGEVKLMSPKDQMPKGYKTVPDATKNGVQ